MNLEIASAFRTIVILVAWFVTIGASPTTLPSTAPVENVHVIFSATVQMRGTKVFLEGVRRETGSNLAIADSGLPYRRDVLEVRKSAVDALGRRGAPSTVYRWVEHRSSFPPTTMQAALLAEADGTLYLARADGQGFDILQFSIDATPVGPNGEINSNEPLPQNASEKEIEAFGRRALSRHYSILATRRIEDGRSRPIKSIEIAKQGHHIEVTVRQEQSEDPRRFVWSIRRNAWAGEQRKGAETGSEAETGSGNGVGGK